MGIAIIPAASSAGKTLKKVTLTSGTTYTVPSGVTEINVLCVGGGGGGGSRSGANTGWAYGGTGGTTTFSGATSALGGVGGAGSQDANANRMPQHQQANSAEGGQPYAVWDETGSGGNVSGAGRAEDGRRGQQIWSTLSVTPGQTISYSIGAGGSFSTTNYNTTNRGGNGGSGYIHLEYWS